MKIIFLDVDGVLNFDGCQARTPNGFVGVADALVKKLKRIVDGSNAILVLSSSWRKAMSAPEGKYLTRKLNKQGLHISSMVDVSISDYDRCKGILSWIENNTAEGELEAWCILDDVMFIDYLENEDVRKHVVNTSESLGLTDSDVDRALRVLNNIFEE